MTTTRRLQGKELNSFLSDIGDPCAYFGYIPAHEAQAKWPVAWRLVEQHCKWLALECGVLYTPIGASVTGEEGPEEVQFLMRLVTPDPQLSLYAFIPMPRRLH